MHNANDSSISFDINFMYTRSYFCVMFKFTFLVTTYSYVGALYLPTPERERDISVRLYTFLEEIYIFSWEHLPSALRCYDAAYEVADQLELG